MKNRHTDTSACVHCGSCRERCPFLTKHQIEIGDEEKVRELAYHCFLCGKCSEVCPAGIDGRSMILNDRREHVIAGDGVFREKTYGPMLAEKKRYLFRNYRHVTEGSVLFPGCNFPSFYPKTMRTLAKLLFEEAGIGTVYDCCGKPIAELGLSSAEAKILRRINETLLTNRVKEVITVCPNCFAYLKDRLSLRVISIYEKLAQLGLGDRFGGGERVFLPCPDREEQSLLGQIQTFADAPLITWKQPNCCGLGGSAGVKEPLLAKEMAQSVPKEEPIYVYCATCAGSLARNGCKDVRHVLAEILGTQERPDTARSMLNRAGTKLV